MKKKASNLDFECVEPALGDQLQAHLDGSLEPEIDAQVELHLAICRACQERRRVAEALPAMFAASPELRESLAAPAGGATVSGSRRAFRRWAASGAVAAFAASVILLTVLRPTPLPLFGEDESLRGGPLEDSDAVALRIVEPHENEVIVGQGGELRWTEVDEASFYEVTVQDETGRTLWSGKVRANAVPLPPESAAEGVYLAAVEPRPLGIAADRESSVMFQRDTWLPWFRYRLTHLPLLTVILAGLAIVLALLVPVLGRRA